MSVHCVVIDIETVAFDLAALHSEARRYLLRAADAEPTEELRAAAGRKVQDSMALWPLTGKIVAIAMLNPDTGRSRVYYDDPEGARWDDDEGRTDYIGTDEPGALAAFWRDVARYPRIITFNGRGFDGPWLMLRSAVHRLRPTRNLIPYRYDHREHTDLLDQLTFYGATRKYSLDFYCRAFGIESPKDQGVQGKDVGALYHDGRFRDIARYCRRDVGATAELYRRWHASLCFDEPAEAAQERPGT